MLIDAIKRAAKKGAKKGVVSAQLDIDRHISAAVSRIVSEHRAATAKEVSAARAEARREALEEMDAVLSSNQQLRSDLSRLRSEYDGLLKLWAQERDARSIVEAKLRKAYECQLG